MKKLLYVFLLSTVCLFAGGEEELPPVDIVTVKTAKVQLVNVPLPVVIIPEIVIPEMSLLPVPVAKTELADCGIPTPSSAAPADGTQSPGAIAHVETAKIASLDDNMVKAKAFRELFKLFKDKKTILNDMEAGPDSAIYEEWKKVYENEAVTKYTMAYCAIPGQIRMIAEARVPVDRQVLLTNLKTYRSHGYNSVLITFSGSDSIAELKEIARLCRENGMSPWFAFGGKESITTRVFIAPALLKRYITELAKVCDGMLLGWRRTSLHLFLPDKAFLSYIIKSAREANSSLLIVGESYLGRTVRGAGEYAVTTNLPANSSGCLLVNLGYYGINPKVLTTMFSSITTAKLVLVVGERPYYKTFYNNGRTFEENLRIKRDIEDRFISAGANGTVTLHGDGSDSKYNRLYTDNIAQTGQN